MKRALAIFIVVGLAAAPAWSGPLEAAKDSSTGRFTAAVAASLPTLRLAARMRAQPLALALPDLARLFNNGTRPAPEAATGWFAGRRCSAAGVSAQLLVGLEVQKDPDAGPLGGVVLKLASFGGPPPGPVPAATFDSPSPATVEGVLSIIDQESGGWRNAGTVAHGLTGVERLSLAAFELRLSGSLLVARYADGSYAYFFRKVR
ncbi:MAG: hypothetical protein KGO96_11125 [Elusimicrobia bacterium]|nr:hypothetical protein [Elusimicrobiota bacterium]MDE2237391.1 hypothetical protein [Elusimicrobiota bacterium]MDE2426444.1 hypothetical protein [Elusimicrobiota bacterium]